jgi:hypothetical protein
MVHFQSEARDVLQSWGIAWHYQTAQGTMIAQNNRDIWTIHTFLPFDAQLDQIDPAIWSSTSLGVHLISKSPSRTPGTPTFSLPKHTGKGASFSQETRRIRSSPPGDMA